MGVGGGGELFRRLRKLRSPPGGYYYLYKYMLLKKQFLKNNVRFESTIRSFIVSASRSPPGHNAINVCIVFVFFFSFFIARMFPESWTILDTF